MSDLSRLHDRDFAEWARRNAELPRAGDLGALDVEHLLEELDDMGKSEGRELEDSCTILLAHLLDWQYQTPAALRALARLRRPQLAEQDHRAARPTRQATPQDPEPGSPLTAPVVVHSIETYSVVGSS